MNEKLRFSCTQFRGFSGMYNIHESNFSPMCVCMFFWGGWGVGGFSIILSFYPRKFSRREFDFWYHNVELNYWCEKIIGELFYCKLQFVKLSNLTAIHFLYLRLFSCSNFMFFFKKKMLQIWHALLCKSAPVKVKLIESCACSFGPE